MHRNVLIAEVLKGNREAVQVLSDMIEEEGEYELAAIARKRKLTDRKLLKLGIETRDLSHGDAFRIWISDPCHLSRSIEKGTQIQARRVSRLVHRMGGQATRLARESVFAI